MKTITVEIGGRTAPVELSIEEYCPLEPSNYCYDPGWICFEGDDDTEYFVSESGIVYVQPLNIVVGVEPNIVKQWQDYEKDQEKWAQWENEMKVM